jgi:hypothetical protein
MQARVRTIGLVFLLFAVSGLVPAASAQPPPQVADFQFSGPRLITSTQGSRVSGVVVGDADFFVSGMMLPFTSMAIGAFDEKVSQGGRTVTGTITFQFQMLTAADTLTFSYTESLIGGATTFYFGTLTSASGTGVFLNAQIVLDPTNTIGIAGLVDTVNNLGISEMAFSVDDLVMPIGVP